MGTVDLINELAVSIDADMREQQRDTRRDFPLSPAWAHALTKCPDWPESRVAGLVKLRRQWFAADVAELALTKPKPIVARVASSSGRYKSEEFILEQDTPLSIGDAIWLLTQDGALPRKVLQPFAESCAWWACDYAMDTYAALPVDQIEQRVPREGSIDWRNIELRYRVTARVLDSRKGHIHGAEAVAWRFMRASRASGMVHALQLCEGERHEQLKCVPRVAQMAVLCAVSAAPEQARQLRHLLALVS